MPSTYGRTKGKDRQISGSRASLHAKTFVFDRRAVFIGSLNLDPRSVQLNTEIGVVCESEPMADEMASGIEAALDKVAWRVERVAEADGKARLVWIETTRRRRPAALAKEPEVSAWRQARRVVPRPAADRVAALTQSGRRPSPYITSRIGLGRPSAPNQRL